MSVVKLVPEAFLPTKATPAAAGFDLFAVEESFLEAWAVGLIRTGLRATPPVGCYLRITGRSGLTMEGLLVQTGVVDPDYTGELKIMAYNVSGDRFFIPKGLKVAQMVPERYAMNCAFLVQSGDLVACNDSNAVSLRGTRGFGSSGY